MVRLRATSAVFWMALDLASLAACRDAPTSGTRIAQDPVTFAGDMAPILFERCAPCHHPGGSAPFSVLDYESVRTRARQIAAATFDGRW